MNVGASTPEEAGLYFSWGNTEGHEEGSGYDFSLATYEATAAAAIDSNLSLEQDMARANLGEPWRMPTHEEFQELYDNCTCEWTTLNGTNGMLFTSDINGKTVFFPAAGIFDETSLDDRGSGGYYWSSSYYSAIEAGGLDFNSSDADPELIGRRRCGFSVRAIQ